MNCSNTANFVNIKITPAFIREYLDTSLRGDGAALDEEPELTFDAGKNAEVILFDMRPTD